MANPILEWLLSREPEWLYAEFLVYFNLAELARLGIVCRRLAWLTRGHVKQLPSVAPLVRDMPFFRLDSVHTRFRPHATLWNHARTQSPAGTHLVYAVESYGRGFRCFIYRDPRRGSDGEWWAERVYPNLYFRPYSKSVMRIILFERVPKDALLQWYPKFDDLMWAKLGLDPTPLSIKMIERPGKRPRFASTDEDTEAAPPAKRLCLDLTTDTS